MLKGPSRLSGVVASQPGRLSRALLLHRGCSTDSRGATQPTSAPPPVAEVLPCTRDEVADFVAFHPQGHSCFAGTTTPTQCKLGTYAATLGFSSCKDCPGGKFMNDTGATACSACTAGNYCPPGASAPLSCKEGTYSNATDLASAVECSVCPAGSSCVTGSVNHSLCVAGTFAASSGQSACEDCAAGSYQAIPGQTGCDPCLLGFFCEEGSSVPLPCPITSPLIRQLTTYAAEPAAPPASTRRYSGGAIFAFASSRASSSQ